MNVSGNAHIINIMNLRFAVIQVLWILAHVYLYYSFTRLFKVKGPFIRRVLLFIFILLSVSFLSSAFLARRFANPLTNILYALSAFWTGLAIYLIIAAVLCWVIAVFSLVIFRNLPDRRVSAVFFAGALFYSLYGVWNAFIPVVKTVEVELQGLPDAWRDKTVIQITDVHLGAVQTPGCFRRMADKINSLRPDLILISGDLFDAMSSPDDLSRFIEPLNALEARDGIFFATGNHEYFKGVEKVFATLSKTKVRALRDEAVVIDGLQIAGVDYPGGKERDVRKALISGGFKKGLPTVLLYHMPTNIEEKGIDLHERRWRTYWAPDVDFSAAKELGVGLQLSGHTHCGQIFPFNYLARRLYKGYDRGLKRDGNFSIHVTCGLGTFGPPMRTGNRPEIVVIRLKPGEHR